MKSEVGSGKVQAGQQINNFTRDVNSLQAR